MIFPFRNFKQKNQINRLNTATTIFFTNNLFSWDGVKLLYKTLFRQTSGS